MYGGCALTYASFLDQLIAQECDSDLRLREQSLMVSKPKLHIHPPAGWRFLRNYIWQPGEILIFTHKYL